MWLSTCLHSFPFPCTGLEINFIDIFFHSLFFTQAQNNKMETNLLMLAIWNQHPESYCIIFLFDNKNIFKLVYVSIENNFCLCFLYFDFLLEASWSITPPNFIAMTIIKIASALMIDLNKLFLKKREKISTNVLPIWQKRPYQTPFRLSTTKPAYPPGTAMDPYNARAIAEKVPSHTASQEQGNFTLPSPSNLYQSSENGSISLLKIRNAHSWDLLGIKY